MLKGKMNYKMIGAAIIGIIIFTGGLIAYANQSGEREVVSLGSQRADIEDSLSIESVNTIEDFEASAWIDRDRVLGIKGQSNDDEDTTLCIYNQLTDTYENIATTKAGETVIVGEIFNKNMFFYSSLIDDDFMRNRYRLYLYNLEKNQIIELSNEETDAAYDESRQQVLMAEGFQVILSDLDGNRKEIVLPDDLRHDLNDFSSFTFQDYNELYYSREELTGDKLETIKSHYEKRVKYNAIRTIGFINDQEIFITADNNKEFVYNINTRKYRIANDEEHKKIFYTMDKPHDSFEIVRGDISVGEPQAILWSLDDNGNRKDIIDTGVIYHLKISPDKQKIIYVKTLKNNEERTLVYDSNKEKGIEIFTPVTGRTEWDQESKQFFITGGYKGSDGTLINRTSIVKMRK